MLEENQIFFLAPSAVRTEIVWLMKGEHVLRGAFCDRLHKLLGVSELQKLDTFSLAVVHLSRVKQK